MYKNEQQKQRKARKEKPTLQMKLNWQTNQVQPIFNALQTNDDDGTRDVY